MNELLLRRRVAAAEEIDIPWLIAHGCICWLPLSSEGDLLDRISGKSLSLTGKGSMVWDDSAGMYVLTSPSDAASTYVAYLDNGMNKQTFPNNNFTVFYSTMRISTGGAFGGGFSPLSTNNTTQSVFWAGINGTQTLGNWGAVFHHVAQSFGSSERIIYQDGNIYGTSATPSGYLPNDWSLSGDGLCVGMLRNVSNVNQFRNKSIYIKDIYIFNKVLTLEEIRKIQGYD